MLNIEFKVCLGSASLRSWDDSCVHNTPNSLCELLNSFGVLTRFTWFKVLPAAANIEKSAPNVCVPSLKLSFTCTTDEYGAAEGHAGPLARVDPYRQRFDQSPLLKGYVIRQPGSLKISHRHTKKQKDERKSSDVKQEFREIRQLLGNKGLWNKGKQGQIVTCSRSWHCVCRIGKDFRRRAALRRRRWSETGCICPF